MTKVEILIKIAILKFLRGVIRLVIALLPAKMSEQTSGASN